MSNDFYHAFSAALVAEIKQYFPGVPIRPQSVNNASPAYPYITYKIYDDYGRVLLSDVENETFDLHVQFKAISNDEMEAKSLAHQLRKLFFLQQPEYDLFQKSIVAKGCDAIPPVDQYLEVRSIRQKCNIFWFFSATVRFYISSVSTFSSFYNN